MSLDPLQRVNFRAALRDEVATLRAISAALRGPIAPTLQKELIDVRERCLAEIRHLPVQLCPAAPTGAPSRAAARVAALASRRRG